MREFYLFSHLIVQNISKSLLVLPIMGMVKKLHAFHLSKSPHVLHSKALVRVIRQVEFSCPDLLTFTRWIIIYNSQIISNLPSSVKHRSMTGRECQWRVVLTASVVPRNRYHSKIFPLLSPVAKQWPLGWHSTHVRDWPLSNKCLWIRTIQCS